MDRCPTPLEVRRMVERVRSRARRGGVVGIDLSRLGSDVVLVHYGLNDPHAPLSPAAQERRAAMVAANRALLARAWLAQLP
jgi:hypothetical protein